MSTTADGLTALVVDDELPALSDLEYLLGRDERIAEILTALIGVLADLGYLGWDEAVITGRRKPKGKEMPAAQRAANRLQAQLRCVGERGNARLKWWKVLATELRCRLGQCTAMVKAVLALHYMENDPFASLRAA